METHYNNAFTFGMAFFLNMPVCSSSSGTREKGESIITVTSPKYESIHDSFVDEDSLESAESDHDEIKSLMFPVHVSDLCQLCFF